MNELEKAIWMILRYHINIIANEENNPFDQFKLLLNDIEWFNLHDNVTKHVGDAVGIDSLYGLYYNPDDLPAKNFDKILKLLKMQ